MREPLGQKMRERCKPESIRSWLDSPGTRGLRHHNDLLAYSPGLPRGPRFTLCPRDEAGSVVLHRRGRHDGDVPHSPVLLEALQRTGMVDGTPPSPSDAGPGGGNQSGRREAVAGFRRLPLPTGGVSLSAVAVHLAKLMSMSGKTGISAFLSVTLPVAHNPSSRSSSSRTWGTMLIFV